MCLVQEQAALHALLHKVLTEAEQQWKVHWAEGDVRKGELMLKVRLGRCRRSALGGGRAQEGTVDLQV